jgi:hypothetical protein
MRTLVLAIALLAGCVAESPPTRVISHPMSSAVFPTCAVEKPIGSNIDRYVCRDESSDDQTASALWRDKLPVGLLRGPSSATDTPGVRVYH